MSAFKLLRGRTILVDVPVRKESALKLSEKDEDMIMAESINLEVVERIDIDGKIKFVLNEGDVVIVW